MDFSVPPLVTKIYAGRRLVIWIQKKIESRFLDFFLKCFFSSLVPVSHVRNGGIVPLVSVDFGSVFGFFMAVVVNLVVLW